MTRPTGLGLAVTTDPAGGTFRMTIANPTGRTVRYFDALSPTSRWAAFHVGLALIRVRDRAGRMVTADRDRPDGWWACGTVVSDGFTGPAAMTPLAAGGRRAWTYPLAPLLYGCPGGPRLTAGEQYQLCGHVAYDDPNLSTEVVATTAWTTVP